MTSHPGSGQSNQAERKSLLDILQEKKIISAAQAQLALADQEVTGLNLEDIVIARGWINEEDLAKIAPPQKSPATASNTVQFQPGGRSYDQNLKEYRKLLEKILDTPWD
jgi:hypothetical protein